MMWEMCCGCKRKSSSHSMAWNRHPCEVVLPRILPQVLPRILPQVLPRILPQVLPRILPQVLPRILKETCPNIDHYPQLFWSSLGIEYVGLCETMRTYNFIHLSVQEYLAAYHVSQLFTNKQLDILKDCFWKDLLHNVVNIYMTITKGECPGIQKVFI